MKASVFVGTSLDGFIARIDGALDFLTPWGGEPHGYDEFMATVDALIIGRNTYETVLACDEWPYGKEPVFVLSTSKLRHAPSEATSSTCPARRLKSPLNVPLAEYNMPTSTVELPFKDACARV